MTTWRVLTWNILGARRPNLDVITKVIVAYEPDVVALQEVQRRQTHGLARRLGWKVVWTESTTRTRRSCGGAPRAWRS